MEGDDKGHWRRIYRLRRRLALLAKHKNRDRNRLGILLDNGLKCGQNGVVGVKMDSGLYESEQSEKLFQETGERVGIVESGTVHLETAQPARPEPRGTEEEESHRAICRTLVIRCAFWVVITPRRVLPMTNAPDPSLAALGGVMYDNIQDTCEGVGTKPHLKVTNPPACGSAFLATLSAARWTMKAWDAEYRIQAMESELHLEELTGYKSSGNLLAVGAAYNESQRRRASASKIAKEEPTPRSARQPTNPADARLAVRRGVALDAKQAVHQSTRWFSHDTPRGWHHRRRAAKTPGFQCTEELAYDSI
ncbi:hypothetical protein B0H16DRAFT_1479764 [Mycena metata]|uniref:Uncharacterized protein n=1 Tax=Mycena metata TaxID=1033252 RepID=A0AAD7H5H8_9AGAR|nr:hypothetical protein B0H16DRAFT_1479764 [Mycena metata]